ncbi:MAG: Rieske 2Fe-2S domain-containing protein [Actinomycetota bacterium]|nr:Rieske 2Fe-2S domain-containing protein [Actinomycetota bacterium]
MTTTVGGQQLVPVMRLDDIPPGTASTVEVDGCPVTLLRHRSEPQACRGGPEAREGGAHGGEAEGLYAIEAFCTHAAGPLGEGRLTSDHCIVCPWHGATFDARSGQVLRGPARKALRTYVTVVEDGTVFIAL